jgi:putative phosphoesterase
VSEGNAARPFRIGVVSDTHGEVPETVLEAFEGVDAIVHAGDCGTGHVLDLLEAIAPVTAVCGNCDLPGALPCPHVANVVLGGVRVVVAHRERDLAGSLDPATAGARVAIIGHSHVAAIGERDGVLWVNPGSAAFPREGQPPSVAIISVTAGGGVSAEIVPLG